MIQVILISLFNKLYRRALLVSSILVLVAATAYAQDGATTAVMPAPAASPAPADSAVSESAGSAAPGGVAAEDKRAFGVLPNYRTVEGSQPFVPITAKQKLTIATKDTIDGPSYVLAGLFSGLYQLTDQNPSFGQGMKGYSRRYGSAIADQDLGNYMTEGFIPVLLHEDPRFFRRGYGKPIVRALLAARGVVWAHTDKGGTVFNFSEFLGNGVTAAVGNAYYPDEIGFTPTMVRMFTQIGTDALSNVLKEFWPDFKHKVLKK